MIVGLETSSTDLSIAIAEDDGTLIGVDGWSAGHRHASELLPRLLDLTAASGRSLRDTTLVVVGDGPGSFTGLRVGMSVAKAIAVSVASPLLGSPSLVAWLAAEPSAAAAVSRAGARECYVLRRDEQEPTLVRHEDVARSLQGTPAVAPLEIAADVGLRKSVPPWRAAAELTRVAAGIRAGDADLTGALAALDTLEPRYLRAPRGLDVATAR